mmetsp:Transcript_59720/g.141313  ORF Transcript_59720/g.141313 Transcript_59720/m.141313 type:complete len:205 (+) Transcript_59720:475-1089(+)
MASLPRCAAGCLVPLAPGDEVMRDDSVFPPGRRDADGQQLDLRPVTSWNRPTADVPMVEVVEVQLVNSVVPMTLMQSLLPLLTPRGERRRSFVVNVTSAEGQFDSGAVKTGEHPHTNMAKAALNMLTRTFAGPWSTMGVFVTSVDTGWVSRMRPGLGGLLSDRPPLSDEDGAARVLDPVLRGMSGDDEMPQSGVLLRHFEVAAW